jgi:hypothetical protein
MSVVLSVCVSCCLSVCLSVSVVRCQIRFSASGWANCGVSECDREACIMRSSRPTRYYGAMYRVADKSLARPTSRCILFDGENISFDASLVIYINSTNIPPIMIINRIYETQNFLSL